MKRNPFCKIATLLLLQQKRLLLHPVFLLLLCATVLAGGALGLASGQESGVQHILLASEGDDPLAQEVIGQLCAGEGLIRFEMVAPEQAYTMITKTQADEAWVFPDHMEEQISEWVNAAKREPIVRVITREQTPVSTLVRERLYAALYPYLSRANYDNFLSDLSLSDPDGKAYQLARPGGDLVEYQTLSGAFVPDRPEYLRTTLYGLLALCVLFCAFACELYALRDTERGVYDFLSLDGRPFAALALTLSGSVDAALAALLALVLSGNAVHGVYGCALMLCYAVCCAAFAVLLGALFATQRRLGAFAAPFFLLCAVVCPIFLDLASLRPFSLFLPTGAYLRAIYDGRYAIYMIAYTLLCTALFLLIARLKAKIVKR